MQRIVCHNLHTIPRYDHVSHSKLNQSVCTIAARIALNVIVPDVLRVLECSNDCNEVYSNLYQYSDEKENFRKLHVNYGSEKHRQYIFNIAALSTTCRIKDPLILRAYMGLLSNLTQKPNLALADDGRTQRSKGVPPPPPRFGAVYPSLLPLPPSRATGSAPEAAGSHINK